MVYTGVLCVYSHGEAESICALSNLLGYTDHVITRDGDAFLYGASSLLVKNSVE